MLSVTEAQQAILANVKRLEPETVHCSRRWAACWPKR